MLGRLELGSTKSNELDDVPGGAVMDGYWIGFVFNYCLIGEVVPDQL